MNKQELINNSRHNIQPFIDWLIDNSKVEKKTLLFSYMETYLSELKEFKTLSEISVLKKKIS